MNPQSLRVISASKFLLATVWITALSAISSAQSYQAQLDKSIDPSKITTLYDSFSVTVSIALVFAWIVTSRWLGDAVKTVQDRNPGQVKLHRAWARWGWIAPVVSLWFPRQIIANIIGPQTDRKDGIAINTWWAAFIGFSLLSNAQFVLSMNAPANYNPIKPEFDIAGACLLTAAYFIWIQIVQTVDQMSKSATT
ncbi:MAG: DUF4328 domain-containing protein [Actinobacteria bacterium]|uniref:Unannotated protein n=1 Tax=freshwater metagenome TaxID=449393 RepID=A0A6J5YGY7_9ZZZZ|nr:DUF4328 domain-containing protein [Actinomycetota bacterium]